MATTTPLHVRCDETCPDHPTVAYVHFCPACRASASSPAKTAACRLNGKKGGWPKGRPRGSRPPVEQHHPRCPFKGRGDTECGCLSAHYSAALDALPANATRAQLEAAVGARLPKLARELPARKKSPRTAKARARR